MISYTTASQRVNKCQNIRALAEVNYSTEYMCTLKIRFNLTSFNFVIAEVIRSLKTNLGFGREDCQHAVIDEFLCMAAGCALGTDVCHWMFKQKSTWFKVNKIPPLSMSHMLSLCCSITPSTSPYVYFCSQFSPFVYGIRSRFSHWVWAKRNVALVCRVCVAYDTWSR